MPKLSKFDYGYFRLRDSVIRWGCTSYYKVKRFLYFQNFNKKHLTLSITKGRLQITSKSHQDYIDEAQKKLNKLAKKLDRPQFIRKALAEAIDGCNYIIFSTLENENKFVQFWTGGHQLKYNYYANDVNKLKNYFLSNVGLLSEMGFVNKETLNYRGTMIYEVDKGANYISVDANFRKDIDLASEFTEVIFKQLFKIGKNRLVAKVE